MFFQAMRMDGDIGFYNILPDQISVIESVITIPMFAIVTNVIFPLCRRCGFMKRALHKVILGGSLVGMSLLGAGVLSAVMEQNYPNLPVTGQGQISIYNTLPCDIVMKSEGLHFREVLIPSGDHISTISKVKDCKSILYKIDSACYNGSNYLKMCEGENYSYFFKNSSLVGSKDAGEHTDGLARIRWLQNETKLFGDV